MVEVGALHSLGVSKAKQVSATFEWSLAVFHIQILYAKTQYFEHGVSFCIQQYLFLFFIFLRFVILLTNVFCFFWSLKASTKFCIMTLQGLVENINASLCNRKDEDAPVVELTELTRKEVIQIIQSEKVRFRGVNLSGLDLSKLVRLQSAPLCSFLLLFCVENTKTRTCSIFIFWSIDDVSLL